MKEPNTMFNTHILTAKGLVTIGEQLMPSKAKIDLRCTSDVHGETFSITFKDVQIAVKVSDVEKIITEARENRKDIA